MLPPKRRGACGTKDATYVVSQVRDAIHVLVVVSENAPSSPPYPSQRPEARQGKRLGGAYAPISRYSSSHLIARLSPPSPSWAVSG